METTKPKKNICGFFKIFKIFQEKSIILEDRDHFVGGPDALEFDKSEL